MKNWADALRKFNEGKPHKSPAENDREADIEFLKLLEEEKQLEEEKNPTYKNIPRFFYKKPNNEQSLYYRVRQEARTRFLQNKTAEVLDKEDLEQLWYLLKEHISLPEDNTERINYDQFVYVSSLLPPKCRQFFTSSTFLKFERDEYGRIEIVPFFHYVVRKVNLFQTRIQISLYDSSGYGYLKEKDLENYIFELMPTFPQLQNLQETFYPFYVITAVRKFFFFLDPKRTGKILIKDMLTSPILAELYELRQESLNMDDALQNWFSVQSSLRVYDQYLKLDQDKNGMLKKYELANYSKGLTKIFIDRIFEEYQTFEGEMDYKTFLDFVLAMENKKSPQALQYFWRVLDVFHKNAIDTFVINMFFRAVIQKLETRVQTDYKVDDLKDELWDMAKPQLPYCITLQDLINCGVGDIIVSMLTDAKAFYEYDQRETGETEDFED
ncbi:serine threonine-protein phosphatase 2a regulatory subunit b subunit gamma [Stylonychia lemnae]|uniref:Serine/threonine-protein phosphatase 2A regulatory subunit B'' subunit gamma n=1 Tax=Stylonychia lemnae TaxID=5949 RepID=A0A078B9Q1_STYLE|nr:serine threonine-protein phosphatase 2a regulatory subunit b subunit gamma [Stylonychia lemnae]|eukprot:CDW90293.1 serine threonine-protein phosphatase 2a regulatory subunit b subunit gamma [Stylonychia lemnae]